MFDIGWGELVVIGARGARRHRAEGTAGRAAHGRRGRRQDPAHGRRVPGPVPGGACARPSSTRPARRSPGLNDSVSSSLDSFNPIQTIRDEIQRRRWKAPTPAIDRRRRRTPPISTARAAARARPHARADPGGLRAPSRCGTRRAAEVAAGRSPGARPQRSSPPCAGRDAASSDAGRRQRCRAVAGPATAQDMPCGARGDADLRLRRRPKPHEAARREAPRQARRSQGAAGPRTSERTAG